MKVESSHTVYIAANERPRNIGLGSGPIAHVYIGRDIPGDNLPIHIVITKDVGVEMLDEQANDLSIGGISVIIQLREHALVDQMADMYKKMCGLVQNHQLLLEEHQRLRNALAAAQELAQS